MTNIFEKLSTWRDNKRRERMRGDIMAILKTEYSFDAFNVFTPEILTDEKYYTSKLVEYLVWFSANGVALQDFYKNGNASQGGRDSDVLNYYWSKAPKNVRKCHTGLAKEISTKMATIVFGNGVKYEPVIYKESEDGKTTSDIDLKASKNAKELIEQYITEVNLRETLNKAEIAKSWSGHIAIKIGFNLELASYPILQVYDRRYFDVIKESGITTAIVFHNFLEQKKKNNTLKYRHDEEYSIDLQGHGTIINHLIAIQNNTEVEIDWEKAASLFPQFEDVPQVFVSNTKGMLARDLTNTTVASYDPNNPYGDSDYAAAISAFDYLDECYSALPRELRDKRFIRTIPKDRVRVNEYGQKLLDDGFTTNYLQINEAPNVTHPTNFECPPDETENHIRKYNMALVRAINLCGLAPSSLGITGIDAINNSDATIREKSKATLETRNAKIQLWIPFLKWLITRMLSFQSEMQSMRGYRAVAGIPTIDVDWENIDVKVTFGDYIETSMSERIATWGNAKNQGIVSLEECVKNLHPEWDEESLTQEINRIKFEQGISDDNPDSLMLEDSEEEEEEPSNNNDNKNEDGSK